MINISRKEDRHYLSRSLPLSLILFGLIFGVMVGSGRYEWIEATATSLLISFGVLSFCTWLYGRKARKIYASDMTDFGLTDNTYENSLKGLLDTRKEEYTEPLEGLVIPYEPGQNYHIKEVLLPFFLELGKSVAYLYIDRTGVATFMLSDLKDIVFAVEKKAGRIYIKSIGMTEQIFDFENIILSSKGSKTKSRHLLVRHIAREIEKKIESQALGKIKFEIVLDDGLCRISSWCEGNPDQMYKIMLVLISLNKIFLSEKVIVRHPHLSGFR